MGISFKVAKTGTRFRAKPPSQPDDTLPLDRASDNVSKDSRLLSPNDSSPPNRKLLHNILQADGNHVGDDGGAFVVSSVPDHELSFTLNLFPDGFSIGAAEGKIQPVLHEIPKSLHPYDRKSETLFSAIESGLLPGDILDDIPGKYLDGTIVCEVRDYRKCVSDPGGTTLVGTPVINKVNLRMSLENVVKDMPFISDDSWTYSDLMEVESRILKALRPQLYLDPSLMMDKLCHTNKQLDLGIFAGRKKRLRQSTEVTVTSNNQAYGKKVSIDKVPDDANKLGDSGLTISSDVALHHVRESSTPEHAISSSMQLLQPKSFGQDGSRLAVPSPSQSKFHSAVGYPKMAHPHGSSSPANMLVVSPSCNSVAVPDSISSYADNCSLPIPAKRENSDALPSPISCIKRQKQTPIGHDSSNHLQQLGQPLESLHRTDVHWKNSLLQQHFEGKGPQYANIGVQKYAQQLATDPRQTVLGGAQNQDAGVSLYLEQQGMRCSVKEERPEIENPDKHELDRNKDNSHSFGAESTQLDQQRLQRQQFLKPYPPSHTTWQNLGDPRKDDSLQKRKSVQSPRVSSGAVVQSPLSSKSGEPSSGSLGPFIGTVATAAALGPQKEKAGVSSSAVGTPSVASSPTDSMQRQHQTAMAARRRTNSMPKTSGISGVGSPAIVSTVNLPLIANSPSVGTPPLPDQVILDRVSKIDWLTQRYQLNCKKTKVENYSVRKPTTYSTQEIAICLANSLNLEDFKDTITAKPMSKSLIGGSINICKSRVLTFSHMGPIYQGNGVVAPKFRNKLVLLERPSDGTVAMQHGDFDDINLSVVCEYGPRLPNTNYADLLAAQFSSLMMREGYQEPEDQIRPIPILANLSTVPCMSESAAVELQFSEAVADQPIANQQSGVVSGASGSNASINPPQNMLSGTRMLPPGNAQTLQMSQGYLGGAGMPPRPQMDQRLQNQQPPIQQHQQPQIQRSSLLPSNPLSHLNAMGQNSNLQMGNHMVKPSMQQFQMLQQQQQQAPQQQQRKMMMAAMGNMGMGNMGNMNNMVGLGGLGNVVGMGGVRGMGPAMSTPMGPISGLSDISQSQMNPNLVTNFTNMINQHLRSGSFPQQNAALLTKLRLAQNRGGMMPGPQSGITGVSGNSQMHAGSGGLSMMGQTMNRANMSPLQRNAMVTMGPPKTQGMNFYMNQQQLQFQQLQQKQQQQQLQQQQQQMQPQQQQIGSPLQHQQSIISQPQACSSSGMAIQQQLGSPPQMNLQSPMSPQQLSSGTLQQINAGNAGAGPASPQLSSQTLGSVNSITSSPMDLQCVNNKGNSINNV